MVHLPPLYLYKVRIKNIFYILAAWSGNSSPQATKPMKKSALITTSYIIDVIRKKYKVNLKKIRLRLDFTENKN